MIRFYNEKDVKAINSMGKLLHDNYSFDLDIYSRCLIIEKSNQILGFIVYSIIYDRAEIVDIIIDEGSRRNGLGNLLLRAALDDCKKNGCKNISLEVKENNSSAINFYKTNGFKIVAVRKKYYGNIHGYLMNMEVR